MGSMARWLLTLILTVAAATAWAQPQLASVTTQAQEVVSHSQRRVVQLEDAVTNWERFAAELRQSYGNGAPPA